MKAQIQNAELLSWAQTYRGKPFSAVLCDPPYHLTEMTNRFGKAGAAPAKFGKDGAFQRAAKGFLGKAWDGGDIAFRPSTWAAIGRHLHPGAFLMAFAGSKGYHRLACAIEDAGFVLHPAILWVYAQGMPKATRIDRQIADAALAKEWEGHRYGGQALKPACEFICVAQKPYVGKPIACMLQTGAGALNIRAGRIGRESEECEEGGWPSNLLLESGLVAEALDLQSGLLVSGFMSAKQQRKTSLGHGGYGGGFGGTPSYTGTYGDEGGASRFYFQSNWNAEVEERIALSDPFKYQAKAGQAERSAGIPEGEMLRLRDDLTAEERAFVYAELKRLGVQP